MKIKPTKIVGLQIADFDNLVNSGEEIHLRPARLLNFHKPGDESFRFNDEKSCSVQKDKGERST